jgi:hypothetical protein
MVRQRGRTIMKLINDDSGPSGTPSNYPDRPMTLDELAQWLGTSRRFLEGQINCGKLRVRKISPRCIRILPNDVARWLDQAATLEVA